jgi:tRNA-specific 2-thiouridylase
LDAAIADGAEMIATGHYARVANNATSFSSLSRESSNTLDYPNESGNNKAFLLKAANEAKDQTYFLYRVTGEAMKKTLFPIGDFATKEEVRKEAEKRGLVTARKKDSQGICFVGSVGIREFLSQFIETTNGDIIEKETGKVLGRHDGAIFYTFGQRHGLNVGGGLPYYVVGKDMARNEVYVSTNLNNGEFWRDTIDLSDIHWINDAPEEGKTYQIRVRHRAPLIDAEIICYFSKDDDRHLEPTSGSRDNITLKLKNPERAIASGQSVVIYDDEVCLGGGIVV